MPPATDEAVIALMDLASPVAAFVRDRCDRALGEEVAVPALYDAWTLGPKTTATSPAPPNASAATSGRSSPAFASFNPAPTTVACASIKELASGGQTSRRYPFLRSWSLPGRSLARMTVRMRVVPSSPAFDGGACPRCGSLGGVRRWS